MLKSAISPAAVQSLFDSAANATIKGQAQWFTPLEWARVLSQPLNEYRPVLVDLTCGNGSLLKGADGTWDMKGGKTHKSIWLGCDLDAQSSHFVQADITRFHPLLHEINWTADLFALNPPRDLHWFREPLRILAESECPAVREAFIAHDGRTSADTIDSSVATLCMALDRCSDYGEGFLIGNEATLQRLILGEGAPHHALACHVWAHLSIEGNICTAKSHPDFKTGVIYFARGHKRGPMASEVVSVSDEMSSLEKTRQLCLRLKSHRLTLRDGPEAARYQHTANTVELWQAAREEHLRLQGKVRVSPFNIWFDKAAGVICTHLNVFDTASGRVDKTAAAALHALNGRQPLQLVVQRSQRQALLDAVNGGPAGAVWRVDPQLQAAVEAAIVEYNRVRAPLYPLPKIQRLGYLDEHDYIECCRDLGGVFTKGCRYAVRSTTVAVRRVGTKANNVGLLDDVEWNGQELAFFIADNYGMERCFMEKRLRAANVTINLIKPGAKGRKLKDLEPEPQPVDFTLNDLARCFVIPDVPDVAAINPRQYAAHLKVLDDIVNLVLKGRGFNFRKFQREDYARAALHDGVILGHDTGLGKTIAEFIWPLLKVGYLADGSRLGSRLCPARPVLLVVPGDGHEQTDDESLKHFGTKALRLDCQAAFLKLATLHSHGGHTARCLPPNYYLTSYTQLTSNGVEEFSSLNHTCPARTMSLLNLKERDAIDWWNRRGEVYRQHYERLSNGRLEPLTPNSPFKDIEDCYNHIRRVCNQVVASLAFESFEILKQLASPFGWEQLSNHQQQFIRSELVIARHREFSKGIGLVKTLPSIDGQPEIRVKCVYSPSLADLCQDCFAVCVVDEGTKIKGGETLVGTGVRQINAHYRLVLTATPIKNRFPDVFHLAHYVCGGHNEPTARFPYAKFDKQTFGEEFLVSERNLTKEADSEDKRRFVRFTPQVCNVHRAWKLLAPIILRRRKDDCGEDIVPKVRHVVRVPMGLHQAAAYQFHLKAKYRDYKGRPAIGAKLQALRIAAANPASSLLERPEHDVSPGEPRSRYSYIPKVASALELVRQAMERREQIIIGSAFQDGLDVFSARLNEAGVKHLLLDGRVSQKRRGELARLFKQGCPRAVDEGLIRRASDYPVLLAGQECMAELHNFHLCNNVLLTAYSWAFDKFEQFINRAHRLNSPWPVNVWSVVCDGSIDRKLEGGIHEKKDAAELVLDGHLLGEYSSEVNLAELLAIARKQFAEGGTMVTVDEKELEREWSPLRSELNIVAHGWRVRGLELTGIAPCTPFNGLPEGKARQTSSSPP